MSANDQPAARVQGTDDPPAGRVLVPTGFNALGQPVEWVEVDQAAADHWDERRWRARP